LRLAGRQCGDAIQDLGAVDSGRVERSPRLGGNPGEHCRMRLGPHQLGQDVGVEDDHGSNDGGSRTSTGGCGSSSTPPRVADLTYVAIPSGFVYLAAILDAWSRKVVG
jgi:transposase InsO family protein